MITTRKQGSKAISNKNIAFTAFAAFTAFTSNVKKCTTLSCVFSTQIFNADFQRRFSTQKICLNGLVFLWVLTTRCDIPG